MATHNSDQPAEALNAEERDLRLQLSVLHDRLQSGLKPHLHEHQAEAERVEKAIRNIVLRLVAIEREQIELNIGQGL